MAKYTREKKIVKAFLDEHNLPYTKLTGRMVDFTDLLRSRGLFIKIHGWQGNPLWTQLEQLAKEHGFRVETDGIYVG